MNNQSPSDGGLSSVDNALRLVELLGERQVLRVAEAATLLGVARPTAHRLLAALRRRGFALQDRSNGPYRPGPVLNEVGLAAIGRIEIRRVARPVLEELRDTTRETVSLSLLENRNVRFIDCVEGPRAVRVGDRTGVVLPAHCTAGGKAILASLPEVELHRRYQDRELVARTASSLSDWQELVRQLEQIRSQGYALNLEEGEAGISAVSVALRDLTGAPLAAIAVVLPSDRIEPEAVAALAPAVQRAARQVQEMLQAGL